MYPHDADAYTQGLIYVDGFLFESTGLNGRSSLRKVELQTGKVVQQYRVDSHYFAEGLTEWEGTLIQLTWRSHVAFLYALPTFTLLKTLAYPGEGWGLTHDARALILSDGTDTLRFLEPSTLREIRRVHVHDGTTRIRDLNELEYVDDEVYANVWHTNRIARIDPQTGEVKAWIDLTGLMSPAYRLGREAVLNGIAFDSAGKRLFVTGKLWPQLFEITVRPRPLAP